MDTNENTTRASYSEEERRELVQEFHSSDLTQAAFCRDWNLNSKTLARWLRIERDEREISFCEVELGSASASGKKVSVHFSNGIEVSVPVNSSQELGGVFKEVATCLD